jgi:hypothetical protein
LDSLPPVPPLAEYLWEYYQQLHNAKPNYGWGETALISSEIEAWCRLRHVTLDYWELEALLKIDRQFLLIAAKAKANQGDS